ncbi:hypothetical protein FJT64_023279 [Amphibalanus amphitrite]|uniref:Uncharacterized protein n=1 Tax=Amphibalanus amphitrite TaxID=1232801 RepID=A0A6A4WSA2_AMPAM|nr:hypothetical protein FJT64_023279 [Amphibalanus amphitrite]KAF0305011.1 hypothetical protein FJT64_023279 [Amphibalanus amphitrite]
MGNALATYQGRDGSEPPPETVTLLDLPLCTDDKLWRDRIMREARTLIVDELSDEQAGVSAPETSDHNDREQPAPRPADDCSLENKSVLRRMMMDKAEGLHVHSLVPSANRGVGAGVRFRFSDDATFDLITLYSNTSEVRRRRTLGGAASQTRLYASVNEGGRLKMEPFVTDLLQHADGVVHVVEAAEEKGDYGFESLEREAMQEAMTESGRQLPLLTLLLAAEPPHSRSSTLGWRAQQRLAPPPAGPHAVLTTSVCSLTDLAHGFSWLTAVCRLEKRQHEAAPDRPEQAEFAFGATASAAAATTASGGT